MSDKNGSAGGKPDVAALREDIRQTRAELGETVQALAAKADVKARAKEQVAQTRQKAKAQVHDATEKVREVAVAAVGVATGKAHLVAGRADDIQVRRNPVPLVAVLAAGVALVGIILIVRGRRR